MKSYTYLPFRVEAKSLKYLQFELHRNQILKGGVQAFFDIGRENVDYSRQLILKPPKTGRLYRIRGRKRRHRASAPGEAPANCFGNLRKNVGFQINGADQMIFGNRLIYGKFLEMGTEKMEPRPYLIKAVEKNYSFAVQRMANAGMRGLGK